MHPPDLVEQEQVLVQILEVVGAQDPAAVDLVDLAVVALVLQVVILSVVALECQVDMECSYIPT
tara:strand:+ start:23 stop:214 length:192 start_codon:yes stop_codon:yes gene_type:complete